MANRRIKKFVQLIKQSNDRALLPRIIFQEAFSLAINTGADISNNPKESVDIFNRPHNKTVFIRKDNLVASFSGKEDKKKIAHIQKAKIEIIRKDGRSHQWKFIYPDALYLKFINITDRNNLEEFLNESGFCIFPTAPEFSDLYERYNAGEEIKRIPQFIAAQKVDLKYDDKLRTNKKVSQIFKINLDFIEKKRDELRDIVNKYADGKLEYHKLFWVNKNMENVSDIFFNSKHFLVDEITKGEEGISARDKRSLAQKVGMDLIQNLPIVPAYRVYGHYGLCCLEFYLDIMRKNKILICQNCGQYNKIKPHGNVDRQTCLAEENPVCFRETEAKRLRKHREK